MVMSSKPKWVVTSSGERPLEELKDELLGLGFHIDHVMDQIGVIAGRGDEAVAGKIRRVRGVAEVAPDHDVDIGPPDSDKTW
jgi:hypothetical protein